MLVKLSLGKNKQGKVSWDMAGNGSIWQEILTMHCGEEGEGVHRLQPLSTCCHHQIPTWWEKWLGEGV